MEAVPSSSMLSRLTRPMVVGPFQAGDAQSIGGGQFLCFLTGSRLPKQPRGQLRWKLHWMQQSWMPHRRRRQGSAQGPEPAAWMSVFFMRGSLFSSQDRAILCLKILHRTMGRSFHIFYKANLQNHLLCGSKFTIIESKIPLRVQRNCRRAVGSRIFPTEL